MADKVTVTEWKTEGDVTPEMADKAHRELMLATVELIYSSMRYDFERLYPPASHRKDE